MRRVSLAVALASAVAATGCGGSVSGPGSDRDKGVGDGTFRVIVQNGQGQPNDSLQIKNGYVTSEPAGIDCGGPARTACEFDFPAGQAVRLVANPDAGNLVLGWAGDCKGIGSDCTLPAGLVQRYVVIQFGTASQRTFHPNWTASRDHGHEVGARSFTCSACHGQGLQGVGIAPSCVGCHDATFAAAVKTVNESVKKDVEDCATCHASGMYAASSKHAATNVVRATASAVTTATNGTDLEFTVTVTVDGQPSDAFAANATKTTWRAYRHQYNSARVATTVIAPFERFTLASGTQYTVGAPTNGVYPVTIVGGVGMVGSDAARFLLTMTTTDDPMTSLVATAVANVAGNNARDLVADASCVNCHDLQVFNHKEPNGEWHHGANPYGVSACVVCHTRYGSTSRSMGGDRLTAYVHGVHNSHEMPARTITGAAGTVTKPDGVYARNDSLTTVDGAAAISSPWSIGFPGYMVNCASCHDTDARLSAVMAKPVSFSTCMSCHDSWAGFPTFNPTDSRYDAALAAQHAAVTLPTAATTPAENPCATCHDGTTAFDTVGDVHLIRLTGRNGLVYGGRDQSIAQGEKIVMTINSVGYDTSVPAKLQVKWGATLNGAAVDPCNTTVSTTAPIFHAGGAANTATGQVAGNMSILVGYAQGGDWVNPAVGTAPGQPASATNLSTSNTTCSGNEATSTFALPATIPATVTKAVAALQGKPQITFEGTGVNPGQANPDARVIQVRSESPTYPFELATGASAAARRAIVSNDKCLACHPGSLYQHGGNRIDSVALCVMCHNPAANERNNRDNMGVPLASTYDGKAGETYDFRTMIHAIHSAGSTDKALVYYRTNGIYLFGSQATIDAAAATMNWPGAGCFPVAGSTKSATSGGASTGTQCTPAGASTPPAAGAGLPAYKTHNEVVVHYPRHLNDCSACHVNGSENAFPSGTTAMAVTVDSGASYSGQADDVLQAPNAQSCFTCHQSGDAARQAELRGHANDFSWTPTSFSGKTPAGRAWLIQEATPAP